MNNPKVYVVEDSAMTRAALISTLKKNKFEVVGSAAKADKAWKEIEVTDVDIALLDINLAGKESGIWLAEKLREKEDIPFIYLTAYSDPATVEEVVRTKPYGYLTKPYNEINLLTTMRIALDNYVSTKNSDPDDKDFIYLKNNYSVSKININDIQYIQSAGNYINIYSIESKIIVRMKLSDLIDKLQNDDFVQVHQRYLIKKGMIDQISNNYVMVLGKKIPVSKGHKKNIKNLFNP